MIVRARCLGERPRRSASPCSVTTTCTSCSVWSTCETIGTMQEMSPPLAVDGVRKNEVNALRAKSPEPPRPFIIFVPIRCVEFTLPYRSASSMPFMARMPRRRTSSGWLEISWVRRISLSRYFAALSLNRSAASVDRENAVADAVARVPESRASSMPSCTTSVNADRPVNRDFTSSDITAFAMLPTPDCSGSSRSSYRPWATSCSKNSTRCWAIAIESASAGLKAELRSGAWVSTTATTLAGSHRRYVSPMRSAGWVSMIGVRCGGSAVP